MRQNDQYSFFFVAEFSESVEQQPDSFADSFRRGDDEVIHVRGDLEELVLEVGGCADAELLQPCQESGVVVKVGLERSLLLHC